MTLIYESENFIAESHEKPFVSRTDGGHIRIKVKDKSITDRTKLSQKQAIELMRLTIIVGDSLEKGMNKQGIPVVKINYQDMGNWAFKHGKQPFFHIHIYGRALHAKHQPYKEAVYLPDRNQQPDFYAKFKPLNKKDILEIQKQIEVVEQQDKYQSSKWNLL